MISGFFFTKDFSLIGLIQYGFKFDKYRELLIHVSLFKSIESNKIIAFHNL